jgi:hypothetical protein
MEVNHTKTFSHRPNYSIEWGYATWSKDEAEEDKDCSIRNRYDKAGGGFNVRGSSEIPWEDFKRMINESIKEKQFSNRELRNIAWSAFNRYIKNSFRR